MPGVVVYTGIISPSLYGTSTRIPSLFFCLAVVLESTLNISGSGM